MLIQLLSDFVMVFVPLFVVVDPAGNLPLFLALTAHQPELRRREIARRATLVAAVVGVVFVAVGQAVFTLVGVHFADFQIAGGILLVILTVVDLLGSSKPAVDEEEIARAALRSPETISVVPLAVPLIVGPATMTTSLLLVSTLGPKYSELFGTRSGPVVAIALVCVALLMNIFLLYVTMRYAGAIERAIGKNTMLVINKIVMILLAAIAVSLIRQGVTSIVMDLSGRR